MLGVPPNPLIFNKRGEKVRESPLGSPKCLHLAAAWNWANTKGRKWKCSLDLQCGRQGPILELSLLPPSSHWSLQPNQGLRFGRWQCLNDSVHWTLPPGFLCHRFSLDGDDGESFLKLFSGSWDGQIYVCSDRRIWSHPLLICTGLPCTSLWKEKEETHFFIWCCLPIFYILSCEIYTLSILMQWQVKFSFVSAQ